MGPAWHHPDMHCFLNSIARRVGTFSRSIAFRRCRRKIGFEARNLLKIVFLRNIHNRHFFFSQNKVVCERARGNDEMECLGKVPAPSFILATSTAGLRR
jgi:hypothetical protein